MVDVEPWSWVVLTASLLALFFNSSLNYSVGVLHIALLDKYEAEDTIVISWMGALFSSMFALAGFTGSITLNLFNARICVMASGVVTMLGLGLSSLVTNMKLLFITYSLITGIGQAMCYVGTMVSLTFHFRNKTSMAVGIALSGCGLCTFVFPPLAQLMVDKYGLSGAFILLGAMGLQSVVCGALMRPTKYEIRPNVSVLSRINELFGRKNSSLQERKKKTWTKQLIFLHKIEFWFYIVSSFTFGMGQSTSYLFLPDYFRNLGSSSQEAAFILSLAGITGICSRVLLGLLASIVDVALVYGSTFGIMGIVTFFVKYMTSLASKFTYSALFGFYLGASWTLHYSLLVEIVALPEISTALGFAMVSCGIGYLIGPPLAGVSFLIASITGFSVKALVNNQSLQEEVIIETGGEIMLMERKGVDSDNDTLS